MKTSLRPRPNSITERALVAGLVVIQAVAAVVVAVAALIGFLLVGLFSIVRALLVLLAIVPVVLIPEAVKKLRGSAASRNHPKGRIHERMAAQAARERASAKIMLVDE